VAAHLDKDRLITLTVRLGLDHFLHRRSKLNGLPDIVPPILGAEFFTGYSVSGNRGIDGNLGLLRPDSLQALEEVIFDGIHVGTVESIIDGNISAEDVVRLITWHQFLQGIRIPGDGYCFGTVDRRQGKALTIGRNRLLCLLRRDPDSNHLPAGRTSHRSGTVKNDPSRIGEAQRPRTVSRRHFTDTMPDNGLRSDSHTFPEFHQCNLHPENGGLGDLGEMKTGALFIAGKFVDQVILPGRLQRLMALLQLVAIDRAGFP
jgi:hypothetical protein